jgi:broad specificity phosphatase PhoE
MLIFARHGQSQANAAGLLVGRVDSPLTALGRRQAAALGEALAARPGIPVRIVTSPLQRAVQTAEAIAGAFENVPRSQPSADPAAGVRREVPRVVVDPRFVELDYGELDGKAISELAPGLFAHWRSDPAWRPPGGETLLETGARVSAACEELAPVAAHGDVLVVSHVSPIKAAVIWALRAEPGLSWRLSLSVASITQIATDGSLGPALVSFNATGHLARLE